MAKLTKNQLKSIVKECLVEILSEGLASSGDIMVESTTKKPTRTNRAASKKTQRNPALDEVKFNTAAEQRAAALTDDPIMRSILADTAKSTLQEQAQADRGRGASMQETAPTGKNIEDIPIFAEGAQNWAALAFTDKKQP